MKRRLRTHRKERQGTVLVLFAMLLFVLIPMAALVLQSGWLTMTRRQMQTGVNTSAVDALRLRNDFTSVDPDLDRRQAGQRLMSAVYDDDFDLSADAQNFGAGPTVVFSGGKSLPGTDFLAGRQITNVGVYQPNIEANLTNDLTGDIVAGNYVIASTTHEEHNDYTRDDFTAVAPADSLAADSILVRLRRSDESFASGVGTAGGTVPFLFGRGPFGGPGLPLENGEIDHLTRAERGTVVRATAIAQARPAWTVGMRNTPLVNEGVGDFAIDETDWGSTIDVANLQRASFSGGAVSIGDSLTVVAGSPSCDGSAIYYVPITTLIGSSVRVVGFGALDLTCGGMNNILMATPQSDFVAPSNASATYHGSVLSSLPPAERDAVLDAMRNLSSPSLLLAPALQRSM